MAGIRNPSQEPPFLKVSLAFARDLLDELDDISPELGVFDHHKCLGENEPVGGGEKVGDIIWRMHLMGTRSP
jgi:hypothetical protein